MATTRKRGHVSNPSVSGAFEPRATSGITPTGSQSSPYAQSPTGESSDYDGKVYNRPAIKNPVIDEVDYVPYGNVYERVPIPPPDAAARVFLESVPYPIYWMEDMIQVSVARYFYLQESIVDQADVDSVILSGVLSTLLVTYDDALPEQVELPTNEILSGFITTYGFIDYTMEVEQVELPTNEITGGTVATVLIDYLNYVVEQTQIVTHEITGGSLV